MRSKNVWKILRSLFSEIPKLEFEQCKLNSYNPDDLQNLGMIMLRPRPPSSGLYWVLRAATVPPLGSSPLYPTLRRTRPRSFHCPRGICHASLQTPHKRSGGAPSASARCARLVECDETYHFKNVSVWELASFLDVNRSRDGLRVSAVDGMVPVCSLRVEDEVLQALETDGQTVCPFWPVSVTARAAQQKELPFLNLL